MKKRLSFFSLFKWIFIIYISICLVVQQVSSMNLKKELNTQNNKLAEAKKLNEKLQDEYKISDSDKYIERMARGLDLIKIGETPVVINNDASK
ncbi:MAG: septum formation initiator family protein [Oscillospiraceae bacterium]|nr:septum formation initiator family protein [Oscillospiraceae bacterium]